MDVQMTPRIFITGGNSFLGHHILPILNEQGVDYFAPRSKEVNMLDVNQFDAAINHYRPNMVINLAAQCGGIFQNLHIPATFVWENTMMSLNIFEAVRKHNIPKIYSTGSVCMYPRDCPIPFQEDDILNGAEESSNKSYGDAKRLLLSLHEAFRKQYGIGGAFFVPVNMYGIHDSFDPMKSHAIPALIKKFDDANREGKTVVECSGTGEATREFLFAQDAAEAIVGAAMSNFDYHLPINLGTGQEISIKDLAHLIAKLMGYKGDIVFLNDGKDGQPRRCLNVDRAREQLGWVAKVELEDGLRRTISWYRDNFSSGAHSRL